MTTVAMERSSADVPTEKTCDLLNKKSELDANVHVASTTDTEKAFDMNENVITSGHAPETLSSCGKSGRNSEKAALPSSETLNASEFTVAQTVSSDLLLAKSSVGETDKSDLGDVTTDSTSSLGTTRPWVSSSSYRQKLGARAAGRYESITSCLYGDNWLASLSNRANKQSDTPSTEESAMDTTLVSVTSSDESQTNKSKITANNPDPSISVCGTDSDAADANCKPTVSSVHFVYSCSTSEDSTVERSSVSSDSADDDDDDDDDDASGNDDAAESGLSWKLSQSKTEKDVLRWRQRLTASPPPRRAAHSSRRCEDHDRELDATSTDVQSRSVQSHSSTLSLPDTAPSQRLRSPESLKHVSFDPFTLSLNAALEGELDVLQSLFSEVVPSCSFYRATLCVARS